jgi:Repeat of unknown function (DUF5648)
MSDDHFYCLNARGEIAPQLGYEREGITGYVYATQQPGTIPIFRYWNLSNNEHFYTADPDEAFAQNYQDEGVGWYMFAKNYPNTVPLYRWFNIMTGDHLYTTDATGEAASQTGYQAEGILGYLHPNPEKLSVPLFRWHQTQLMNKFTFAANISELDRATLFERHTAAYHQAQTQTQLSEPEKLALRAAYQRAIHHTLSSDVNVNAHSAVSGHEIALNLPNLLPLGDDEIAITLLHHVMHCAGYTHPQRREGDLPGDGGGYFTSAPLRAELCIAGTQSDAGTIHLMLAPRNRKLRACKVVSS